MHTNKPVVMYRSEMSSHKGRQFAASVLLAISLSFVSLQARFVLNAAAQNSPVTSPISAPESPEPSETASPTPLPSAPVTSPEVTPSPTPTPTPTPTPSAEPSSNNPGSSNSGNSNSSSSGGSSAPSCNTEAPKAPRIISAVTTGKNEITLNWEKPVSGNVTHYSVAYGLSKSKPVYGVANVGHVTSFKVAGLAGGVTYYFTVNAVNDCTPSAASNEVAIKVGGKFINMPAQGFSPVVLGKVNAIKGNSASKPAISKPIVFNNTVESKPVNLGLAGKVLNFFQGLFN